MELVFGLILGIILIGFMAYLGIMGTMEIISFNNSNYEYNENCHCEKCKEYRSNY